MTNQFLISNIEYRNNSKSLILNILSTFKILDWKFEYCLDISYLTFDIVRGTL